MREEIYKCDERGKVKGETNHWFAMNGANEAVIIVPFSKIAGTDWKHFCGEGCLMKAVARNLP